MCSPNKGSTRTGASGTESAQSVRDIPKWAGRYARHRTLEPLVGMVMFLLLCAAIALPSYWGGVAYRNGNMYTFAVCLAGVLLAMAALIWLAIPKWGAKKLHEFAMGLYGKEGVAGKQSFPDSTKPTWRDRAVSALFGACILGAVFLGMRGYLPREHMMPVSAIYCVPFLIYLNLRFRRGLIGFVWPLLYALHAILMVAGVPIRFTGPLDGLNILIPVAGYGLLCAFMGHLYSRYALKKLKKLSRIDSSASNDPSRTS